MAQGTTLFARLVELLPRRAFESAVQRYRGNHRARSLTCMDQLLAMIYAQVTGRTSLRETVLCLQAMGTQRYHCGFRGRIPRSSLADANEARDFRIFQDTALCMIKAAQRELPQNPELAALEAEIYALDSTTVVLCLELFPWAKGRHGKAIVKLHTLLDLHTQIPVFIAFSDGHTHDMQMLDRLTPRAGAYYVMDRAYIDFARLYRLHQAGAFFVTRAKKSMNFSIRTRQSVGGVAAVESDQLVRLRGFYSRKRYPDTLRRIGYRDPDTHRRFVFLTNNQILPAQTIALLYQQRWQIELFFKWIKQNLHIKAFFGRSSNAVCTQVWVAVMVFILILRFRKRYQLPHTPSEIMSILSGMILEKMAVNEVFLAVDPPIPHGDNHNQLPLF